MVIEQVNDRINVNKIHMNGSEAQGGDNDSILKSVHGIRLSHNLDTGHHRPSEEREVLFKGKEISSCPSPPKEGITCDSDLSRPHTLAILDAVPLQEGESCHIGEIIENFAKKEASSSDHEVLTTVSPLVALPQQDLTDYGSWTSTLEHFTGTILYYTILYYTILYYTILYYTILYYTILYYTILYYTILYYTILCYTVLYFVALILPCYGF